MDIKNSIELIKELRETAYPLLRGDQKAYDYLIKMVEDERISDEDFYKLALIANRDKICKEIKNCLKIEKKKREIIFNNNLKLPDIKTNKPYTDDWRAYFDRLCSVVSDDAMQDIWAKILVKESLQPGSISKVMLNTFSLLDNVSAHNFEKLCALTFQVCQEGENRYIPLVLYDDILHEIIQESGEDFTDELKEKICAYSKYIPSQREIEYLAELNLIKTSENHMECDIYSIEEMRLFFKVDDKQFEAVSPYDEDENRFYVCVGQVFFTQTGLALYNAIVKNIETYEYLYDVLKVYIEHRKENGGYDND